MKRKILTILVASLAAMAMPVTGWSGQGGGKGGDHGGSHGGESHGGSGGQGGHGNGKAGGAGFASDKARNGTKETGRAFAPGQISKAARTEVTNVAAAQGFGRVNFGTVISSIRAGKSNLTGVDSDTDVQVVDVAGLIRGNNAVALENALTDRATDIDALRADLTALGIVDLDPAAIDDVVAARRNRNGSLTVFVYEN